MELFEMGREYAGPCIEVLRHYVEKVVDVDQDIVVFVNLLLRTLIGQLVIGFVQLCEVLYYFVELFSSGMV